MAKVDLPPEMGNVIPFPMSRAKYAARIKDARDHIDQLSEVIPTLDGLSLLMAEFIKKEREAELATYLDDRAPATLSYNGVSYAEPMGRA